MKSKLFRLISLVLVMVMLINMLPMRVFAEQYRESQLEVSIAAANVVTDAQIMKTGDGSLSSDPHYLPPPRWGR